MFQTGDLANTADATAPSGGDRPDAVTAPDGYGYKTRRRIGVLMKTDRQRQPTRREK